MEQGLSRKAKVPQPVTHFLFREIRRIFRCSQDKTYYTYIKQAG
jgi:hypothetical protein